MKIMMLILYWHAKKRKDKLLLNRTELMATNSEIALWSVLTITGMSSALFALLLPPQIGIFAGFIYFNLPISMNLVAFIYKKKIRKLKDATE